MVKMKSHASYFFILALLCLAVFLGAAQAENASVSGVVWVDKNIDGLMADENGLPEATVTLERKQAVDRFSALASVTTDQTGSYAFSDIPSGEYRLVFQLPNGYHFTQHGQDSSALPAQGVQSYTPVFSLGGDSLTLNAGANKTGSYISVVAFEDSNENGGRMSSEPRVRSIPVTVVYHYEGTSYEIASGETNKDGELILKDLSPAEYTLCARLPENYVSGPLGQKITAFYNCFLPSDDAFAWTAPFTLPAKNSVGMGLGLVKTGAVKGKIWFDENSNGQWDQAETGLTEAAVILQSDALSTRRTLNPESDGSYSFIRLQPGTYELIFELPERMLFSDGSGSLLHAIAASDQVNVSVQSDRTTEVANIGAAPSASITIRVAQDDNANGETDENEGFLAQAQATLSQNGKEIAAAVSDDNGILAFPVVREGEAKIHCELPEGFLFTDESVYAQGIYDGEITVQKADEANTLLLHAAEACEVTGFVFDDPENKGIYRAEFAPLSGFAVQAVDQNGIVRAEAETDENGIYTLSGLLPGSYTVRFLLGDSYIACPFTEGAEISNHICAQTPDYGETSVFTLAPGEKAAHMDGAVFKAGIIDGRVLSNAAHDRLVTNDGGLSGITVTLLNENALPAADYTYDVTDQDGFFTIKGVIPGTYSLLYELPDGIAFPDREENTLETERFAVTGGAALHFDPIAAVQLGEISGAIRRFAPDTALPLPVVIRLESSYYEESYETEADASGAYAFTHLKPDDYTMQIILPDGMVFAAAEGSIIPGSLDSTAEAALTLDVNESKMNFDIVIDAPASLSGCAFFDGSMDGVFDDDENASSDREMTLTLNGETAAVIASDENGAFFAEKLIPGDYVLSVSLDDNEIILDEESWTDGVSVPLPIYADCDPLSFPILAYASVSGSVWNLDGSGRNVSGLPVTLLAQNNEIIDNTATDSNGQYSFAGLLPGSYYLSAVLPEKCIFARPQDAAMRGSFIQSDATGKAIPLAIEVELGAALQGIDIGMGAMGSIGDRAWLDENGNGMQDIGEPDMPGIQIDMYQHGELTATAVTDEFGRFAFRNMYPGEYEMKVTMHKELKATRCQTEFPLVASVLPEEDGLTVTALVTVPSGGENLHCDIGFVLRKAKIYPDAMKDIPVKDWTPYAER